MRSSEQEQAIRGTRRRRLAVAVLMASVAASGCHNTAATDEAAKAAAQKAEPRAVTVTVAPVELRTVERVIPATGTLRGWEQVSVGAKQPGRVVKVLHDIGDEVKPGEVLVELEAVDAELAIRQAQQQLQAELAKVGLSSLPGTTFEVGAVPSVKQAQVALDQSVRELNRRRQLAQSNSSTFQELQDAEDKMRTAAASLDAAAVAARSTLATAVSLNVAIDVARQKRDDLVIRVPEPATLPKGTEAKGIRYAVTSRPVSEGQMLSANQEVIGLVIEEPLRLWLKAPERYIGQIQDGQTARVRVSAYPGKVFEGQVTRINPSVEEISRTFQVEVLVSNTERKLRPGGFAEAEVVVDEDDKAVVVPLEAIAELAGVTKLFVVENGQARAIPVEKGIEGPGWVEVLGDVPHDATVVTTGQVQLALLADGTKVTIRKPEEAGKPADGGKSAPQAATPVAAKSE
jgi:multidrug efflux pump subunit AcrA (membrane-fusion protein)